MKGNNSFKRRIMFLATLANNVRVIFNSPEIEYRAMLHNRRIRCEVYRENNGITGRAIFAIN